MEYSLCDKIEDVIEQCKSTLVIGQAGIGKSTILREMSRILLDRCPLRNQDRQEMRLGKE